LPRMPLRLVSIRTNTGTDASYMEIAIASLLLTEARF
jgi:hypothetical protein